ncbi:MULTISPECIES: sensor histidine kinase [unclassified Mesorhizobium]|uniref:sensor histidine kinase n=1 Tax=unclassified Mesorhizobium TaxID=325217 RepID=UPI001FDEEC75|nr:MULTISPECIES: sensor histidine kinase [unclassified Mesorhizobium]
MVQAIAGQTIRNATSLAQAGAALSSRLISLAKAHDLLTRENWSGADLQTLIAASIEPHAPLARFDLSGERVWLPPNIALSFALALHELTTNAIKYGALSNSTGSISISWKVEEGETSRVLELDWHEKGGPPVARGKRGFGTELLHRILEYEGGGGVTLNYEQSGLHSAFRVGLDRGKGTVPPGTEALPADLPR